MTTIIYTAASPIDAWACDHAPGDGNQANIAKCGALLPAMGISGVGSDTAASITFQGLGTLAGESVSALVCGIDCGDYTVDSFGQVAVPLGSSTITTTQLLAANSEGAYGPAEAIIKLTVSSTAYTIYIPVVIGSAYTSQGQMLRPLMVPNLSQTGPQLGLTRRSHMYAMHLVNVAQISVGTSFDDLTAAPLSGTDPGSTLTAGTSCTGVVWDVLKDDYSFDSMFCWQVNRPFAATVVSVNVFVQAQDR